MKLVLFFNEFKSLWNFYGKTKKSDREIVFYSEDKGSYSFFEGLIDYLTNQENLKICYVTSDIHDPILTQTKTNVNALYIKSLLPLFTLTLTSKLLIMTVPDLHRFHIRRSEFSTHHIYMLHNTGSSFPVIRYGALFHYDTIFCAGPQHNEEIRKQETIYDLPEKNLLNFGYYRLEKIYSENGRYIPSKASASQYKASILLGPSWGENSVLNFCGSRLIRILLQSNYEVIVRPHPMTRRKSHGLIESLNNEFRDYDNYVFADDISSIKAIYESDLLISDWSGFVYEYAFGTERPVLFIDVPQKIVNHRYKEVGIEPIDVGIRNRIGEVLGVDELEKADSVITHLLANKDAFVNEIVKTRNEYVYNFGNSSKVGAEFIREFIKES